MISFSLSTTQEEKFNAWKEDIKEIFCEYGNFTYIFKPYGIGTSVIIYSELLQKSLDLSEVESW